MNKELKDCLKDFIKMAKDTNSTMFKAKADTVEKLLLEEEIEELFRYRKKKKYDNVIEFIQDQRYDDTINDYLKGKTMEEIEKLYQVYKEIQAKEQEDE